MKVEGVPHRRSHGCGRQGPTPAIYTAVELRAIEPFAPAHPSVTGNARNSPHMTRIAGLTARTAHFRVRVHTDVAVTDGSYTGREVIHIRQLCCGDGAGPAVRRSSRHVVTRWRTATRRP
ncbi:hypothetical protein GCM10010321_26830 [Streptomyces chartreusis]|nr:hypothetical protein GCM10010321_26830 [Streptomyces chartreusis]